VFEALNSNMEHIATLVMELTKYGHQKEINLVEVSMIFNKIRDELMVLKKECIKLHF
jgi:hypothetical protein